MKKYDLQILPNNTMKRLIKTRILSRVNPLLQVLEQPKAPHLKG